MFGKTIKIVLMGATTAALLAGCSGGMRGPQMFAGFNGDPHCAPGPKPCPRDMYPEFPLPPGGPYLETPGYARGAAAPAPAQLNVNTQSHEKLTIAK